MTTRDLLFMAGCIASTGSFTVCAQEKVNVAPVAETSSYAVVEQGDHHRVWQSTTTETNDQGQVTYHTNSFTELETGMNVRQPDGSYIEASPEIEITQTGAIAQKTRHQVTFAGNCNSAVAIDLLTADGKRLQSHVIGLAYLDRASGQAVVIAEVKDSVGQLLSSKTEVVYPDAFTDFQADISYQNQKAGLEQNIILRRRPPAPSVYGFNPQSTVLQVLTEFVSAPEPQKQQTTDSAGRLVDTLLDFGDTQIGIGKAFVVGDAVDSDDSIAVRKYWGHPSGRTVLVEEVDYAAIEPLLSTLTASVTPRVKDSPDGVLHVVSSQRILPPVKLAKKATQPMKLASLALSGKGVVLDYTTMSSQTNYTFKGDTTYYVSGTVNLSSNTTIEGGCVIKYTNTSAAKLNFTGPLDFETSAYRPAIFTSKDDNTVGQIISGSTGSPTKSASNNYLKNGGSQNIVYKCLRLAFAGKGVYDPANSLQVWHSQFLNCTTAIYNHGGDIVVRNILFAGCGTCVDTHDNIVAEQVTANGCSGFETSHYTYEFLTNSLFTATAVDTSNLYDSTHLSSSNGVYQTVGAGGHYLADNTYRNAGTTNINATLLSDLRQRTTYPPIDLTTDFTVDTTLWPQAQRDTDTPDLGYHYDRLDYVVGGITLTNATLTLTNGVAIGFYGTNGIKLQPGAKLYSEGTPNNLNHLVRYQAVQEQSMIWGTTNSTMALIQVMSATAPLTEVRLRFTDISLLSDSLYKTYFFINNGYRFNTLALTDCSWRGGYMNLGDAYTICSGCPQTTVSFTNCLVQRVSLSLTEGGINFFLGGYDPTPFQTLLYNNLFLGGFVTLVDNTANTTWSVYDNLFDTVSLCDCGNNTWPNGYNGYHSTTPIPSSSGHDVTVTNMDYQVGTLGSYYYPTTVNGQNLATLIDAGSRNATNAGLYHYTTTTNQVKETNSMVDIGFHYVATDGNGNPIDTDGDGVPDYSEDRNGNGTADTGETDWQTYNSPNGLSGGGGLQVFTPLK